MKSILLIFTFLISSYISAAEMPKQISCLSAREYITTVRFLRENKAFGLQEKQVQYYADQVSKGCSGASQRFIKVIKLLTKMGIDSNTSVEHALKFAGKDKKFTEVFIEVFRQAYDPKLLDLDVLNAMKISLKLSAEFQGNPKIALKDFKKLVNFCLKHKSMDLAIPRCAFLAMNVTSLGQSFDKAIAPPFIELMDFLQNNSKGPQFDRKNALKLAKEVIANGPIAPENFKNAYIFAIAKNGLAHGIKKATIFAKTMAKRSSKTESIIKK